MRQRRQTEFLKSQYTLHVDHIGYTALRDVTILGHANNGVSTPMVQDVT